MRTYALSDTRYLLDIYDQLRLELDTHSSPDVSVEAVLDRSKKVRGDLLPSNGGYRT